MKEFANLILRSVSGPPQVLLIDGHPYVVSLRISASAVANSVNAEIAVTPMELAAPIPLVKSRDFSE